MSSRVSCRSHMFNSQPHRHRVMASSNPSDQCSIPMHVSVFYNQRWRHCVPWQNNFMNWLLICSYVACVISRISFDDGYPSCYFPLYHSCGSVDHILRCDFLPGIICANVPCMNTHSFCFLGIPRRELNVLAYAIVWKNYCQISNRNM